MRTYAQWLEYADAFRRQDMIPMSWEDYETLDERLACKCGKDVTLSCPDCGSSPYECLCLEVALSDDEPF